MRAYISAGEESYPVYTISETMDEEHHFAVELTEELFQRAKKAVEEYEAMQSLLQSLPSKTVWRIIRGPNLGDTPSVCRAALGTVVHGPMIKYIPHITDDPERPCQCYVEEVEA